MKHLLYLMASTTMVVGSCASMISCSKNPTEIIVKKQLSEVFKEDFIVVPNWMELNETNILKFIINLYPELSNSKLRLIRFTPSWELYVDESDLYYEGSKYFYIVKEESPNKRKDLNEIILNLEIKLAKGEQPTCDVILVKVVSLYP